MVFTVVLPLKEKGKHRGPKEAIKTVDFALIAVPSSWILPAIIALYYAPSNLTIMSHKITN